MKYFVCLIGALIIVQIGYFLVFPREKPHRHIVLADKITARVATKVAKKHNIHCIGTGGSYIGHVNMLALSFQIFRPLDKKEARFLVVDSALEYLNAINSNEEIRPFLKEYPFKNVEIRIFIYNADGSDVYDPHIGTVSLHHGEVTYATDDPENRYTYKSKEKETFEEAARIVETSSKS